MKSRQNSCRLFQVSGVVSEVLILVQDLDFLCRNALGALLLSVAFGCPLEACECTWEQGASALQQEVGRTGSTISYREVIMQRS